MALLSTTIIESPPKAKRRPKGPNPLSIKKKKVRTDAPPNLKKAQNKESFYIQGDTNSGQIISGAKRKRDVQDEIEDIGKKRRRRRNKGSDNDMH